MRVEEAFEIIATKLRRLKEENERLRAHGNQRAPLDVPSDSVPFGVEVTNERKRADEAVAEVGRLKYDLDAMTGAFEVKRKRADEAIAERNDWMETAHQENEGRVYWHQRAQDAMTEVEKFKATIVRWSVEAPPLRVPTLEEMLAAELLKDKQP